MADLLAKGAAWLEQQRNTHYASPVTYQRGTATVELNATIGRTAFQQADEYGVVHHTESRDFLVLTAALVLGGSPALPQAGDRILEADGTKTLVYEVMAPNGEPPWRYSDPYRTTLRIHTKHVATEEA